MSKKKKMISLIATCGLLLIISIPVLAADGNQSWSGNANFWESTATTRKKENRNTKTYVAFSGCPYKEMYAYFTQKNGSMLVSAKHKLKNGNSSDNNTSAVKGNSINLRVAREYVLDKKVQISGTWNP